MEYLYGLYRGQTLTLEIRLYGIYVLENKTNAPFHGNIGSLKTVIEKWNKMSEESILKVCKSFQSHSTATI